ncbi:MAG: enoyl-CoA hydratase-related protein, partial [Dehalococcoidia bacterium]|nr:enoyl-CoA hydratase-related protein [Dehalococcoidia bacterium]
VAFTRVGLTPATGGVWLMPRIMGIAKAAELIFTADFLEAPEAQRRGVLNRVVPAADLEKDTIELARKIANGPPIAIRLAKMQLYRGMHTEMDAAFDTAAACQAICMTSEDHKEAVAAFGQKREPIFKGK